MEIDRFEGRVRVDKLKKGILNSGASVTITTRGESNVDTRLGEEIEGGKAKLTRRSVRM